MIRKGEYFIHPQEVWDAKECVKRAASAPKDHWGNRPPKGIIAGSSCPYPRYGRTVRYNGGCVRNGDWYEGESIPLPIIPDDFEFYIKPSWGTCIRRKIPAEQRTHA